VSRLTTVGAAAHAPRAVPAVPLIGCTTGTASHGGRAAAQLCVSRQGIFVAALMYLPALALLCAIFYAGWRKKYGLEQTLLVIAWFATLASAFIGSRIVGPTHIGPIVFVVVAGYSSLILFAEVILLAAHPQGTAWFNRHSGSRIRRYFPSLGAVQLVVSLPTSNSRWSGRAFTAGCSRRAPDRMHARRSHLQWAGGRSTMR
jgi:hypothetical protein